MSKVLVSALLLTGSVHAELALAQKPSQGAGGKVASARTGKASVKAAGKQSGKSSRAVAARSAGKASSTAGRSHKTAVSAAAGSKKAAKTSRDAVKTQCVRVCPAGWPWLRPVPARVARHPVRG